MDLHIVKKFKEILCDKWSCLRKYAGKLDFYIAIIFCMVCLAGFFCFAIYKEQLAVEKNSGQSTVGNQFSEIVTGYDTQHPLYKRFGHCEITIENSMQNEDIYVRVMETSGVVYFPVRAIYVKARDKFTMRNFTAGEYQLWHRVLSNNKLGYVQKTPKFKLEESDEGYTVLQIIL